MIQIRVSEDWQNSVFEKLQTPAVRPFPNETKNRAGPVGTGKKSVSECMTRSHLSARFSVSGRSGARNSRPAGAGAAMGMEAADTISQSPRDAHPFPFVNSVHTSLLDDFYAALMSKTGLCRADCDAQKPRSDAVVSTCVSESGTLLAASRPITIQNLSIRHACGERGERENGRARDYIEGR